MPNCGPNTQINLQRNTEVFWSTIDLNGGGVSASMTPDNTWRVEVLAGYAFNQSATNQDITTLESGNTPDRATQRFNTAINPVEWSMSTYVRPTGMITTDGADSATGNSKPLADWFLWQSMLSNTAPAASGAETSAWENNGIFHLGHRGFADNADVVAASNANVSAHSSNFPTMKEYSLYFKVDNVVYQVGQAAVNEGSIDAAIDSIATTSWSGFGTNLYELTGTTRDEAISVFGGTLNDGSTAAANSSTTVGGSATQSYHPFGTSKVAGSDVTAAFIKNRLSSIAVTSSASGESKAYTFPVTGLSWGYNNNASYLTPEELASLNSPIGQFTGSKTVTGNFTAYLRAGANQSAEFLKDIVANSSVKTTGASANLQIGGTTAPYVAINMPSVQFDFPSHSIDDVVGITVDFLAQETDATCGDEFTMFVSSTS